MDESTDFQVESESSKPDSLDPRIKKHLDLLNDNSDVLNRVTNELNSTKSYLNSMIVRMKKLLYDYYKKHKRVIERTRQYLNSLVNLKIETDSCYVNLVDYEASQFAMEQCRCICNRLEEDIMAIGKTTGPDVYVEALQQLNETNEKVEYWTTKCAEQKPFRDECLAKIDNVYKQYKKVYNRCYPKSSLNGMEYFCKKLYFLKNIQKMLDNIEKLKIMAFNINQEYNNALIQTESLTRDLKKIPSPDKGDSNNINISLTTQIKNLTNFNFIIDKLEEISKSVGGIYSNIINLFDFTYDIPNQSPHETSISSEYHTPNTSMTMDKFKNNSSYDPPNFDETNIYSTNSNSGQRIVQGLNKVSVPDRCSLVNDCIKLNDPDLNSNENVINKTHSTSLVNFHNLKNSTTEHEINFDDTSQLTEDSNQNCRRESVYQSNSISKTTSVTPKTESNHTPSSSMINVFQSELAQKNQPIKEHERSKSYFGFFHKKTNSDTSNIQVQSPKNVPEKRSCSVSEEFDFHLTLTSAEINHTKLNMDLNQYGMNSSIVNNIHLHIGMAILKFGNNADIPILEEHISNTYF